MRPRDGSTAAIQKVRNVFRLGDLGFWIRKALSEHGVIATDPNSILSSPFTSTLTPSSLPSAPSSNSAPYHAYFDRLPAQHRPVVFVSIQEHHSNLLPWRESCADVVVIDENSNHQLDLDQLECQLQLYCGRPLKIGSFSAGSNLTGVLNDTVAIAEILHKYDAFAFFDYAGVGSYTAIDMNPRPSQKFTSLRDSEAHKDGVFLSPHKMAGGPGSSGILAARLEIFSWAERNSSTVHNEIVPSCPAGGTVDLVQSDKHKYSTSVLAREESGTPNILATIRTGLVMRLQEIMDPKIILAKEYQLAAYVFQRLLQPGSNIDILGTPALNRVAVFSAMIAIPTLSTAKRSLQIHYSLLSVIMNDFFGIEMRGGCMCAGPYAAKLFKQTPEQEAEFWELLVGNDDKQMDDVDKESRANDGSNGQRARSKKTNMHLRDLASPAFKPGFVRFSFPYFAREKDIDFVLQSLEWVAKYGFLLIPLYKLDNDTGVWSIRQAVRRAVCQDVNPKKFSSGLRSDYISVATDCIYSLHRLFQHQIKISSAQELPYSPSAAPLAASEAVIAPPVVSVAGKGQQPRTPASTTFGVFNTINQARKSLFHVASMSTSGAIAIPASKSRSNIAACRSPNPSSAFNGSESMVVPDHCRTAETDVPSPAEILQPISPRASFENSLRSPSTSDLNLVATTAAGMSGGGPSLELNRADLEMPTASASGRNSPSLFSLGFPLSSMFTHTAAGTYSRPRTSSKMVNYTSPSPTGMTSTMAAALRELSFNCLEEEMYEVDSSPMAARMRWFAIPIEVAKVYTQCQDTPVHFPKRS
ncbi:hypothetical protein BGZ58_010609 [Dissophora ornata]|nr:hypothetical protein BGZ58_010609 [Dissophora ornata]